MNTNNSVLEKCNSQKFFIRNGKYYLEVEREDELAITLKILEDKVNVVYDQTFIENNKELYEKYSEKNNDEIARSVRWNYKDSQLTQKCFEKIPYNEEYEKFLVTNEKIEREYVHKECQNNVLISKSYREASLIIYKGFLETGEILFDHTRDHVEGILLFEIIRQACVASTHLNGLNLDGVIIISNIDIKFDLFVEAKKDFYIRTLPVSKERGGQGYILFDLFQDGKKCLRGCFNGMSFANQGVYDKLRNRGV